MEKVQLRKNWNRCCRQDQKSFLYDCYGAGTYRDPSRYRHRPLEAFTQLSNELVLTVRAPYLFPHRDNPDIMRSFRRRLELASELIETETPEALLVVLIDAADNAVSASMKPEPADHCFVHDLVRMSELPDNARILISSRTSRRDSLKLPPGCKTILCSPFSEEETRQMVARKFPDPPDQLAGEFIICPAAIRGSSRLPWPVVSVLKMQSNLSGQPENRIVISTRKE